MAQAVWPLPLCADYSHHTWAILPGEWTWAAVFWLALPLTGLVLAWKLRTRCAAAAWGLVVFFIGILPLSNAVVPVGIVRADRFLYLPLVGLIPAIVLTSGYFLHRKALSPFIRRSPGVLVILAVGWFAWISASRSYDWHSAKTLWQTTVSTAPENVKARHNLALELLKSGNQGRVSLEEAARHLEQAVRVNRSLPGDEFFEPYINLGNVYLRLAALNMKDGQPGPESNRWIQRAADILREGAERMSRPGRRRRSWDKALERYGDSLPAGVRPRFGDAKLYLALATAEDHLGRPVEAGQALRDAIATAPTSPTAYLRLALLYARAGQRNDVKILLDIARKLPPRSLEDQQLLKGLEKYLEGVGE
jgi:tetratricopeptide (TPR) repeat protein